MDLLDDFQDLVDDIQDLAFRDLFANYWWLLISSPLLLAALVAFVGYRLYMVLSLYASIYVFRYALNFEVVEALVYASLALFIVFYALFLWKRKYWQAIVSVLFLAWPFSLLYVCAVKYEGAEAIGLDHYVVMKDQRVGVLDKWGKKVTQIDFDGYLSVECNEFDTKPCSRFIGILMKDGEFFALSRDREMIPAKQIRKRGHYVVVQEPSLRANQKGLEGFDMATTRDVVLAYMLKYNDSFAFIEPLGEPVGSFKDYVLLNHGWDEPILLLKDQFRDWFFFIQEVKGGIVRISSKEGGGYDITDFTDYVYKSSCYPQTADNPDYVFAEAVAQSDLELCSTCGGKGSCPKPAGSFQLGGSEDPCSVCNGFGQTLKRSEDDGVSRHSKATDKTQPKTGKDGGDSRDEQGNSQSGGGYRQPTPVNKPQTCGICYGSGTCSTCNGRGYNLTTNGTCGACEGRGRCTICSGSGISGYVTEYIY